MAETLSMRVDHGIQEELMDLVVRISGVGRKRGRMLYDVGFQAVIDVCKSNPAEIHSKTKIPGIICKKIHKNAMKIKKKI
jgi:replicative superfamily II helicase